MSVFVAFCAKEKTEEKNPAELPDGFGDSGVRVPGVLLSSTVVVKGGENAFESLLSGCVAESDLIRRWEIMFPDAEMVVFAYAPRGTAARGFADILLRKSARPSVGVGGVTVVCGASSVVLGGVFGGIVRGETRLTVLIPSILLLCGLVTTLSGILGLSGLFKLSGLFICLSAREMLPKVVPPLEYFS